MEDPGSDSSPEEVIPSRITGIGEGEIQQLIVDLEGLSSSIGKLTQGLGQLRDPLVSVSEVEDPSITARCWTKQVRKLCYDTGDYLYDVVHSGNEFKLLGSRALNASERHKSYQVQPEAPSKPIVRRLPAAHADLIGHGDTVDEIAKLLGTGKDLRVVSIVGSEGVGKTTLAKRLYQSIGRDGGIECQAFLRASPKPDIRRLLTSVFMQIQGKKPHCRLNTYELINSIAKYLRDRRYFVIIDDLWSAAVWGIISRAFPGNYCGSRMITTTQIKGVALACCGYQSMYVFKMEHLSDEQSENLFFRTVFGPESDCPVDLAEVSRGIIRKCGGLPLATIHMASLLPRALNLEEWTGVGDSLPYTLRTNPTPERMKEVVNLVFSTLRPHLKTCLLYFSIYPEGYIVRKVDLIKQWVVEGVLDGIEAQATEEVAGDYFDELVRRGMIQAVDIEKNGKVMSCTLHHIVHDVIVNKSMEENFVIIADYFQSAIPLPGKVRRLSVQFGGARSAYIPESIMVSEVRSLAFFGFLQCFLSASTIKYRHVRVLILHIWADDDKDAFDLTGIHELLRLRYMKISCNIDVKLPDEIQGQQYLETMEVHATVVSIPWDIGGLGRLSTLHIAVMKLSSNDITILQILSALTSLSVNVKKEPPKIIVLDKGGFLNLKFFSFRCMTPLLLIEESAMPKIEKLDICFNAHEAVEARPDGMKPITIEHLPSLVEISLKIGGAVTDADSAMADAVTNHPRNPTPIVQMLESREDKGTGTMEEQDVIMEEYPGTQEEGPAVGWGIATAGWILSPIFTRLVDKALYHMEPGESKDSLSKLVAHMIPRLKLTVEAAGSSEDKVFIEKLVMELKSNFYELEETLDEVHYDRLESQLATTEDAGPANQDIAIESSQNLPESVKICLMKILKKIELALEEAHDNIKLEKLKSNRSTQDRLEVKDRHKTTSREPWVQVIGRDRHLEEITQLIHDTKDGIDPRSVIGIYGIAGSGKTTLAQHVYRCEKTTDHFKHFFWIDVSRNFSVGDIFKEMIYQVSGSRSYMRQFGHEMLRTELQNVLHGTAFLLVLDDIWCDKDSDKYNLYELLSLVLQTGLERGKILLTTRDKNTLSAIGQDMQYSTIEIQELSEKDFIKLFMSRALGRNMTDVRVKESLEGIGTHIAKGLKGLPLAAALVGGLLRKEKTVDHWISVKDDPHLLKGITGILWLCYQHLGDEARRCFAYSSIFPRRHLFERDELVKLWVAEGFIEARDAGQMEEIGYVYFRELVSSSFMLLGEKDSNGGKECFLVHDLLHDIAEQVGGNDFFRTDDGWRGEVPLDVRHLFVKTSFRFLMKNLVKLEKLRSLIIINGENSIGSEEVFEHMLKNKRLRKLRVLVIKTTASREPYSRPGGYTFPASVADLKLIRYFTFWWIFGEAIDLGMAFTKLYHMQVLDFGDCGSSNISCAGDIAKLINLRHLRVQGRIENISRLTWLENLPLYRISEEEGCDLSQLTGLYKLRGKLQIVGLEFVKSMQKALQANLDGKEGLRVLVLEWGLLGVLKDSESSEDCNYGETRVTEQVQADVLEGFWPSEHLEELEIINYHGERYPHWMVGNLHLSWRVQRLVLHCCSPLRTITTTSFFSNLLRLTFQDCSWTALPYHMEHLEKLVVLIIHKCEHINWLGELPRSLKYLEICKCPPLIKSCNNSEDPNWEKIRHIKIKLIGYPRLQDSSQYPDEHGVFREDATLHEWDSDANTVGKYEDEHGIPAAAGTGGNDSAPVVSMGRGLLAAKVAIKDGVDTRGPTGGGAGAINLRRGALVSKVATGGVAGAVSLGRGALAATVAIGGGERVVSQGRGAVAARAAIGGGAGIGGPIRGGAGRGGTVTPWTRPEDGKKRTSLSSSALSTKSQRRGPSGQGMVGPSTTRLQQHQSNSSKQQPPASVSTGRNPFQQKPPEASTRLQQNQPNPTQEKTLSTSDTGGLHRAIKQADGRQ